MKKLDIYGGLLGAGKTTLIQKMLTGAYRGYRIAIIENEIGRVNLDAQEFPGVQIRPLTSGCVCCTLKGNMIDAVKELLRSVDPDYIVIEATGAADLQAIRDICAQIQEIRLNRCIMLVNARKLRPLLKVVGEFYYMQLQQASTLYLNFTQNLSDDFISETTQFLRNINPQAQIISVPLDKITADTFPEPDELKKADRAQSNVQDKNCPPRKPAWQLDVKEITSGQPVRIMPGHARKTTLYTWTYEVKKPFTEEELAAFWDQVKQEDIWRVKGTVSMADGTIRKLDYAFGDIFETEKEPEHVSVLNTIVFIGKRRPS